MVRRSCWRVRRSYERNGSRKISRGLTMSNGLRRRRRKKERSNFCSLLVIRTSGSRDFLRRGRRFWDSSSFRLELTSMRLRKISSICSDCSSSVVYFMFDI